MILKSAFMTGIDPTSFLRTIKRADHGTGTEFPLSFQKIKVSHQATGFRADDMPNPISKVSENGDCGYDLLNLLFVEVRERQHQQALLFMDRSDKMHLGQSLTVGCPCELAALDVVGLAYSKRFDDLVKI